MLLAVIFMLFLLILSLSIAMPKVREDIQRDRDIETMERGKQYVRAIQLYYRKFQRYPPNIDALVKTNDIRFLRKRYIDPTTGKDDWKPVLFGQNKTPTAMGFFGQPLSGTTLAGIGPGGGNTTNSSAAGGIFGNSSFGSFSMGNSTFGNSGNSNSAFGNNSGLGGSNPTTGTTQPGTNPTGTDNNSSNNGPTFGGAGIIGFSPASPKQSVLVFKKKNHYNEWEFTYDPAGDTSMRSGNGGLTPTAGGNLNPLGTNSGTTNSNGTGSNLGGGTSPTTPTPPTTPQQ